MRALYNGIAGEFNFVYIPQVLSKKDSDMNEFSGNPWRPDGEQGKSHSAQRQVTLVTAQDHFDAARHAQEQKQFQLAAEYCRKAVELDPGYLDAWFYLGFNLMDLKQYEEAIAAFLKALEIEKDSDYFKPFSCYNIGLSYYNLIRDEEALGWFNQAVALKPDYVPAINYIGLIYYLKKEYDTAMGYFNRCLQFDPKYIYAYYNLGRCYYYQFRDDAALEKFMKALEIDPDHVEANNYAGLVYLNKKLYPTAIGYLHKAFTLDP